MTDLVRVRATLDPEQLAQATQGPDAFIRRTLEHYALVANRLGQIELAPGWAITDIQQEQLTNPWGLGKLVKVEGVVSGAREPGSPTGDVRDGPAV